MSQPKPGDPPDPAKSYEEGIQTYLKYLPRQLEAEQSARTQYDPQRIADQQALQGEFGPTQYAQQLDALRQLDPESAIIRRQLAGRVSGDLASGYRLPEDYGRELTTQFRGAQAARGNISGTGAGAAEAAFKGKEALNLYQQHLQNAGNFLSGPTPEQQIGFIQGVSPDRSSAYTNPSAGYQGVNIGQQGYQNMLAQYQLSGAGRNPWSSAAAGAGSGALAGSAAGGWGALAGGIIGGAAGYFCDSRIKYDVVEVGKSPSGIPLVEFTYKSDPLRRRFRAAMAQEVIKVFPEAVSLDYSGFLKVDFNLTDVSFCQL